jgi:putative secretion ATPase (PEP-CTERM system associated)
MYESYYGLTTKPFRLTPDPRYFFGSRGHKRALAYLRFGLSQSEGFIVVTGEIGTGKTTLLRMLCEELAGDEFVIAQIVTTQLDADDLLRLIASALGIDIDSASKAVLLTRIEEFLEQQAHSARRVLLVVDEVQNLPQEALEELRMLSNFTIDGYPALQSFLLGQAEFRQALQNPRLEQFRQRVIASCHLSPLWPEETRTYIEHRLKLAGWTDCPQFEESVFADIHRLTGGVPRQINTLVDRILLFGYLEERKRIDPGMVHTVAEELASELRVENENLVSRPVANSSPDLLDTEFISMEDLHSRIVALENQVHALGSSLNRVMVSLRGAGPGAKP